MRYEELTLPLGDAELNLRFHSRFTVLAGLTGPQRRHLIDAIAQLNRGAVRGGQVTLVDAGGRRLAIADGADAEAAGVPLRSTGAWRSLLGVSAEDLGLPRATDDPGRLALVGELETARRQADVAREALAAAREERRRHAAAMAELEECENQLADLGTESDRHRHNRARALVELEEVRATLTAVDAPPSQVARDQRLIDTTAEVQRLADEWADIGDQLDRLNGELGQRTPIEESELAELIDIPDEIPETLTAAVAERDRLRTRLDDVEAALGRTRDAPPISVPTDPRVLTLAALDQETLWLTHRDVLLATEALHAAQRAEEERMLADPAERARVEAAHRAAEVANEVSERRWMPSVLTATISACAAAMLLVTELWFPLIPLLLVVCTAALVLGVAVPRIQLLRARQHETLLLGQVGATDIGDYRARFSENPESERWQRAEQVIEDFQHARQEWQALVGDISPADATALEATVNEWVASTDRERQKRETSRLRRELDDVTAELTEVTDRLAGLLEPYGLDSTTESLSASLQDRVLAGRTARLMARLGDTEEAEAKLTRLLEVELAELGFEGGTLTSRIASYGRELDAANQRVQLRAEAPPRPQLVARIDELETRLAMPAPAEGDPIAADPGALDPAVVELRERRDRLATQTATFSDPDTGELKRNLNRIEGRISGLEASLAVERGLVVANPVDHLVETLVRYRPVWPSTEHEPAPALLDDPFASTSAELKHQLLDAVVEVTRIVQVILLTDDRGTIEWARDAERRGLLTLVAPPARPR